MKPKPNKLLLIDGSALAHRSYFAFVKTPLFNSRGENTGAVYGYTNSLLKILEDYDPSHVAVCFDTSAPTFRHKKFAEYKATREKMDPDMRNQLPIIHEVTEALGIPVVELDGYEADDVIGTLALRGQEEGYSVYLVSGDKDFLQLVSDNISVVSPGRMGGESITYDAERVKEKFQVPPDKVVDLLALAGDKIDNIPGVQGVGLKGAARLVQRFGSVERLLENCSQIEKPKLREKIENSGEQMLSSKELVTIKVDVPVGLGVEDLELRERDVRRLRHLLRRLEFFSMMKKLEVQAQLAGNYVIVRSPDDLPGVPPETESIGLFAVRPGEGDNGGLALSCGEGECHFVALALLRESEAVREWLKPLVTSSEIVKVAEEMKTVIRLLSELGIRVQPPFVDTSVASYLIDPDRRDHSLAYHMEREFGLSPPEFPGRKKKAKGGSDLFEQRATRASCARADSALRMRESLEENLAADGVLKLYRQIEQPLVGVLADMEETGVLIDMSFFEQMSHEMTERLEAIEEDIFELAGERFNVRSSRQLASILFDKLGLPYGKKTKTGYSTSQSLLEKLSREHELPARVIKYREIHKLKSTYVDALPALVCEKTGRIHTTFNQTVAATGRLSSSDPNLQNIPMRTKLGREIRKGFIAGEGNVLLSLDYSQVELRILAHLTGEDRLSEAFEQGLDVHRETAALVYGVESSEVTEEMRGTAKMVNYGLIYGMSSYGLAQRLGIGQRDAQEFMNTYFGSLPRVKSWIDTTVESAREKGYTTTIMGRRRYHRDICSRDPNRREFAERAAVNSPIQGSAADMIKLAMVATHLGLRETSPDARMIVQIHDELLFEVPEGELRAVEVFARRKMIDAMKLNVPVEVEAGHGRNWFMAHK